MSGMEKYSNDWNYKISLNKLSIPRPANLSLSYIEDKINTSKNILLDWAIVKVENENIIINSTVLTRKD